MRKILLIIGISALVIKGMFLYTKLMKRGMLPNDNQKQTVKVINKGNKTIFNESKSSKQKKSEKIKKLTKQQEDEIYEALHTPGLDAINALLQTIDVNAVDKNGWTLLHSAVKYRRLDIIKLLLENGADVNAALTIEDDEMHGWTPLDEALYDTMFRPMYYLTTSKEWNKYLITAATLDSDLRQYVYMLTLLQEYKAESGFVMNSDRRTLRPKDLSEEQWLKKQQEKLSSKVAEENLQTKETIQDEPTYEDTESTPDLPKVKAPEGHQNKPVQTLKVKPIVDTQLQDKFIHSCRYGTLEEVNKLLKQGANVNASVLGQTPLKNAILGDKPEIVKLLLQNGATVTKYELTLAKNHKNSEIIKLLETPVEPITETLAEEHFVDDEIVDSTNSPN